MNWNKLTQARQIQEIKALSNTKPVLIFKHSTRCAVSGMSLGRLERKWQNQDSEKVEPYFLDLIANREVSNQVASEFGVPHKSPQVLVIKNGEAVYDQSHYSISLSGIFEHV